MTATHIEIPFGYDGNVRRFISAQDCCQRRHGVEAVCPLCSQKLMLAEHQRSFRHPRAPDCLYGCGSMNVVLGHNLALMTSQILVESHALTLPEYRLSEYPFANFRSQGLDLIAPRQVCEYRAQQTTRPESGRFAEVLLNVGETGHRLRIVLCTGLGRLPQPHRNLHEGIVVLSLMPVRQRFIDNSDGFYAYLKRQVIESEACKSWLFHPRQVTRAAHLASLISRH